jgi:hypothetical protein
VLASASTLALSPAQADSGRIQFTVVKAGVVIGGSGGSGTLTFKGRRYPLSIGGLSYGFTFGASQTISAEPSATFAGRRMSKAFTRPVRRAPRSVAARRRSC